MSSRKEDEAKKKAEEPDLVDADRVVDEPEELDSGNVEEEVSHEAGERRKKAGRGDLAELLSRKNEMLQELEKKLSEAAQTIAEKDDRLLRLAAEFENFRKRTGREWELHKNQANAELMTSLLGVLDDFDRAFEADEGAEEHFREGVALIRSALLETLRKNGLEPIDAIGREFDPQFHEAMGEMESERVEKGHVAEVIQKGYMLKDQVLRPSRVIVSRGSDE